MTFLAPWALAIGALGAAATLLLHLIARHRPAVYLLPTARFIPEGETLVSRAAARPSDLLLLAVRVLLLLAASVAFAQPVLTSHRLARARIVMLDRSTAVADPADAWRRARALLDGSTANVLVTFDGYAQRIDTPSPGDSSLAVAGSELTGSTTAALVAARRAAGALAQRADSVELVLVSPIASEELDAATDVARAVWPGAILIERVALRSDPRDAPVLGEALSLDDPLGPAVAALPVDSASRAVRLRRAASLTARDSASARAGGTIVWWDTSAAPFAAEALTDGHDVIVATLARHALRGPGPAVAWWADGTDAAREQPLGAGCVRVVGVGLPTSGDLPLRPAFQRIARRLLSPCASRTPLHAADSASVARLAGGRSLAAASVLRGDADSSSPFAPWLLLVALVCAVAELALRNRGAEEMTA
jgi:Aerotolerance regulator N-terminal